MFRWIYPFLDVYKPWAVFSYFTLLAVHIIIFFVAYGLWLVKQQLLAHFKPGFDATFEEVIPEDSYMSVPSSRSYQRVTSEDEMFYTATSPPKSNYNTEN